MESTLRESRLAVEGTGIAPPVSIYEIYQQDNVKIIIIALKIVTGNCTFDVYVAGHGQQKTR